MSSTSSVPTYKPFRRRTRPYDIPAGNEEEVFKALVEGAIPTGTIIPTALQEDPEGTAWRLCNGQSLVKEEFPELYAVFKGITAETETEFQLPDMRGRIAMGASAGLGLFATGGQERVVLTESNMPAHAHEIDDKGHTHAFTAEPHGHAVNDPGHTHTAAEVEAGSAESNAGSPVAGAAAGTTGSATTGITLGETVVSGSNASATTGVKIKMTGNGTPFDILPPVIGINWMVRT